MNPTYWTIIGLIVDVVGAFFLSAEAIGIENLRRLRTKWMAPLIKRTRRGAVFISLMWVVIAGISVSMQTNLLSSPWLFWPMMVLTVFLLLVVGLEWSYDLIMVVDYQTQEGSVGIIGFILMFLGFALQLLGTALSL